MPQIDFVFLGDCIFQTHKPQELFSSHISAITSLHLAKGPITIKEDGWGQEIPEKKVCYYFKDIFLHSGILTQEMLKNGGL